MYKLSVCFNMCVFEAAATIICSIKSYRYISPSAFLKNIKLLQWCLKRSQFHGSNQSASQSSPGGLRCFRATLHCLHPIASLREVNAPTENRIYK